MLRSNQEERSDPAILNYRTYRSRALPQERLHDARFSAKPSSIASMPCCSRRRFYNQYVPSNRVQMLAQAPRTATLTATDLKNAAEVEVILVPHLRMRVAMKDTAFCPLLVVDDYLHS